MTECILCHSNWPEDEYRMSSGKLSKVCRECARASIASQPHNPASTRAAQARVRDDRQRRSGKTRIKGKTRIYRAGDR